VFIVSVLSKVTTHPAVFTSNDQCFRLAAGRRTLKGVILIGPSSVWFGTVVILTRWVQWTANAFTVRFATKVNRAHEQVQFGSIWRTCICENNKIVIAIIMCSKLMFLQRFKYTDHYYIANIWCSRRTARFVSCGSQRLKVKVKQKNHSHTGMAPNLCRVLWP